MSRGAKRRRQPSVLSGSNFLEDRVALSSIGPSNPNPTSPPSLVGTAPDLGPKAIHPSHVRADLTVEMASHPSRHLIRTAIAPTVKRWSWLANTYWYVPTSNLSAVLFNSATGTLAPVSDQTVFQITGYRDGYFWWKSVTQLGSSSSSASSSSMVGSVTPQGRVLLTFTTTSSTSAPSVTEGFGTMRRRCGQWTMENQMFTSPDQTLQIGHWAYMVQTHPGLPSWNSLPGADVSVPAFLSQAEGSGPQPITS
jgi:hypothetical protein